MALKKKLTVTTAMKSFKMSFHPEVKYRFAFLKLQQNAFFNFSAIFLLVASRERKVEQFFSVAINFCNNILNGLNLR